MGIKISDLQLPLEKLETEYKVVSLKRWVKDGENIGWVYECILPKLRYEKLPVKIESELPVITMEELNDKGMQTVVFESLQITPWARANNQFVSVGISAVASKAHLLDKISNQK